jgi:hypothetical protein
MPAAFVTAFLAGWHPELHRGLGMAPKGPTAPKQTARQTRSVAILSSMKNRERADIEAVSAKPK